MSIAPFNEFLEHNLSQWDTLYESSGRRPDLSPEWTKSVINAHGVTEDKAYVLYSMENLKLVWCLPILIREERRFAARLCRVEPINNLFCIHFDILSSLTISSTIEQLISTINNECSDWDEFIIQKIIRDGELYTELVDSTKRHRFPIHSERGQLPPYLSIGGDWQEFLENKTSNFRYNLKRKERKIQKKGSFAIQTYRQTSDLPSFLEIVDLIEKGSWKHAANTSMRPFERHFYESLLSDGSEHYKYTGFVLWLDETAIAYDLSLSYKGIGYCLKTSYLEDFAHLSPGVVLRRHVIESQFEDGAREYDFLGNNEKYKLEWANGIREEISLFVANNTIAGRIKAYGRTLNATYSGH